MPNTKRFVQVFKLQPCHAAPTDIILTNETIVGSCRSDSMIFHHVSSMNWTGVIQVYFNFLIIKFLQHFLPHSQLKIMTEKKTLITCHDILVSHAKLYRCAINFLLHTRCDTTIIHSSIVIKTC